MKTTALTRLVRIDEWDAMCAETERLRVMNHDLRQVIDGLEAAAHEERAAVVAWLRDKGHAWRNAEVVMLADFIKRGEHRREEER